MTITKKENGAKKLVEAILKGLPSIEVGIFQGGKGSRTYGKGGPATVLDIANYQEFGTRNIPARSFIGAWFDKEARKLLPVMVSLATKVAKGTLTREQYIKKLGNLAVGGIQKYISQGIPPPLSDTTIKRKGSSKPLIDTGLLRSSITFRESK